MVCVNRQEGERQPDYESWELAVPNENEKENYLAGNEDEGFHESAESAAKHERMETPMHQLVVSALSAKCIERLESIDRLKNNV
ncbi:MAG: hypothetical protein ABI551_19350 [Polyangiaceae bacterium]